MNKKDKIAIIVLLAIIIILIGSICLLMNGNTNNKNNQTTQINNTTNTTTEVINATLANNSQDSSTQESSSSQESSSVENEPEYGSDDYVDKWDESQKTDTDWAYRHDQPVKTENGHECKRMYDPDTKKGYWYQMDQEYDEDEYFNNK